MNDEHARSPEQITLYYNKLQTFGGGNLVCVQIICQNMHKTVEHNPTMVSQLLVINY